MVCPLCGRRESREPAAPPWALVRGLAYLRCPECSYIYRDRAGLPTPEDEAARYLRHQNDPSDPGYRAYLEAFIEKAVLPFAAPGARVLDFGSGPVPALAALLREHGYRTAAYDPFFAPDRSALAGPFDLVAVHEVAEHLARPYFEFARLSFSLTPGGCIAVRTRYAPEDPREFEKWWYREDPTHVGFFGSRAFDALAARLGMDTALDDRVELAVLRAGSLYRGVPESLPPSSAPEPGEPRDGDGQV